jgi:rod shape-determining protein MreC
VARRPQITARLALSAKEFLHRLGVGLLVLSAAAMILLGKADAVVVERLRIAVTDVFSPVLSGLSWPVQSVDNAARGFGALFTLRDDNALLRGENARLRDWFAVARQLEVENSSLRQLLNAPSIPDVGGVAARIIADSSGEFSRSALVVSGQAHSVQRGQAVVNAEGLVGRVVESGYRSSRVLFIIDLNSRVPVLNERSRERGILIGDNSYHAILRYLSKDADVVAGDRIVTSGDGGVFPAGLDVGEVVAMDDARVSVRPFVHWSRLEYVRILGLASPGIVDLAVVPSDSQKAAPDSDSVGAVDTATTP